MVGSGKLVGTVLLVIAALVLVLAIALLGAQVSSGETTLTGAILGIFIVVLILVAPLGGAGVYLLRKGQVESGQFAEAAQEKKLLNMVLTQGKVRFSEAAIDLNVDRDQVEAWVRDLVGKKLFSGAVSWKDGVLYSEEARLLKKNQVCPNCGAKIEIAGKGVMKCPYCGTEIFLHN